MNSLSNLLNTVNGGIGAPQFFTSLPDIPMGLMLLILGLCIFGTLIVAHITARNTMLDYGVIFSSLFLGALITNNLMGNIELSVGSQLAHSTITANIGMTCAGLLLLGTYGTQRS